ncbi:deoxyribodipyrimidine photolyase [Frondihabitans sp. PAMC 28766]|uniref:cryptochrome/photolyase family protein n=1 Tax=Frondihabitans sp. PAMC 28766 TaxID=1795630 RepID=UPI00078B20F6|nr:cryptochrome/photolyase family protein [Frondihabitans sp. PAMC 28766]AMM22200.1 deoxyribodipyrimidine photolyase [Frondihabitans sp. PAMC 28766]
MPDAPTRWLFSGQLGPLFSDDHEADEHDSGDHGDEHDSGDRPILLIEARSLIAGRPIHRAKAHLQLSAIRHRARELGDRVDYHRVADYGEALEATGGMRGRSDLEVIDPTSYAARRFVREAGCRILPSRGFVTSEEDFRAWADARGGSRLLLEDFYRATRERTGLLMEGDQPVGGHWNYDHDNRAAPPKGAVTLGLPDPWWPTEDDIDDEVRHDLDAWQRDGLVTLVGADSPRRFAVTTDEAQHALDDFVESRLGDFGPFEDATLTGDWTMAHSLLSAPLNLGLLDPREVVQRVAAEHAAGNAPLNSVEGFVRQVAGWRDYVWHLYWYLGEGYAVSHNALHATESLPAAFWQLRPDEIEENCLHHVVDAVREHGWAHHIQRLMVLGNWALQRGYDPVELNSWFIDMFVDGTPWVMPANVVGMSQHADGGIVATKPYASGGAYIDRMTDYCGSCRFSPKKRLGPDACPFTAGYWAFLDRTEPLLAANHRMAQPLAGLRRLADREQVVAQERERDPL